MENQFKQLLDSLNDAFFIVNKENNIEYVNAQAGFITGYSIEELVGMNITNLISSSKFEKAKKRIQNNLFQPDPLGKLYRWQMPADGDQRFAALSGAGQLAVPGGLDPHS